MTHVVTESCIKCKFTDCVDVCPVDCFKEGPNMLVIDPDECIDCAVCIPECPVEAEEDFTHIRRAERADDVEWPESAASGARSPSPPLAFSQNLLQPSPHAATGTAE